VDSVDPRAALPEAVRLSAMMYLHEWHQLGSDQFVHSIRDDLLRAGILAVLPCHQLRKLCSAFPTVFALPA
jgi:hypothetical protein